MGIISHSFFYTSLAYNVFLNKFFGTPWFNRIDDVLILGALPFRSQTQELLSEGVRGVITVNQPHETKYWVNTTEEWASYGVKHLILETPDLKSVPSDKHIKEGVDFIMNMRKNPYPNNVYIHCKAGRSRSATIAACYLIQFYGCTPKKAVNILANARPRVRILDRHWDAIHRYHDEVLVKPIQLKLKNSFSKNNL